MTARQAPRRSAMAIRSLPRHGTGTKHRSMGPWHPMLISIEETSMTLQERLDAIRPAGQARIRPEAQTVMHRSIDDLRASGIMSGIVKVGQPAPAFTLPNGSDRP